MLPNRIFEAFRDRTLTTWPDQQLNDAIAPVANLIAAQPSHAALYVEVLRAILDILKSRKDADSQEAAQEAARKIQLELHGEAMRVAAESNKLAGKAVEIGVKANELSTEAIDLSKSANMLSNSSNRLAKLALGVALGLGVLQCVLAWLAIPGKPTDGAPTVQPVAQTLWTVTNTDMIRGVLLDQSTVTNSLTPP